MLILGINGSPNKDGNTATLLKAALEEAQQLGAETELLHVTEGIEAAKVPYCNLCSNPCVGACSKSNKLGELYERMCKADGIIVGSPVYFGTVSAQLKGFWDKTRYLRRQKVFINVVAGALTVASNKYGGQETTVRAIQDMLLVQGFTVVGDGSDSSDAGHQGACAQKPALEDENGLKRARIIGQRVTEVARATQGLRRS